MRTLVYCVTGDFHLLFSFSTSASSSQATLWLFLNDIHSSYPYDMKVIVIGIMIVIENDNDNDMISRVSQKNQKSEFCYATNPSGFHRLAEPPKKISAL